MAQCLVPFEILCRMLMRKNAYSARKRPVPVYLKVVGSFLLFLGVSLIAGCGVFSTTGSTTTVQPQTQPTVASAQPVHTTARTSDGDFTITLDITPNRSGANMFIVHAIDNSTNKPVTDLKVMLYTTMQDMQMGTNSLVLHANGHGQFSAASEVLYMGGHWGIGVTIQTADHVVHKAGVSIVVPF